VVPHATIGGLVLKGKTTYFYMVMIIAGIMTLLAKNIVRARTGRAFIAIRDNDLAAEVMGVNLWVYKLTAFFVGCVFAGIAGGLSVQYLSFCNVEQFPFINSVWYLGMLIIGGMGSTSGVIFGVVALKLLDQFAIKVGPLLANVINPQAAVGLSLVLSGMAIIIFLIFAPHGIAHLWERIKNNYRAWPF
jgi:branched-chain amino acid transport system permease protein